MCPVRSVSSLHARFFFFVCWFISSKSRRSFFFFFFWLVFKTGKTHFYLVPGTHNTCFLPASLFFIYFFQKGETKHATVFTFASFWARTHTHARLSLAWVVTSVCATQQKRNPTCTRWRVIVVVVGRREILDGRPLQQFR
uniref:(northern house mosquito) hypothetical protein n=1 Tax=Culex pipiens TaxID=7175 RepID=A0A8D8J9W3_CULPI